MHKKIFIFCFLIFLSSCTVFQQEVVKEDVVAQVQQTNHQSKEGSSGIYTEYVENTILTHEKNILFFYAPWCPSCKVADESIKKGDIPKNVALLKVDYDSSDDLKQKYGVTYQHTFVQIDTKGNMTKKWAGGNTLQDILEEIQ